MKMNGMFALEEREMWDETTQATCAVCGSVVANKLRHFEWHEEQNLSDWEKAKRSARS